MLFSPDQAVTLNQAPRVHDINVFVCTDNAVTRN